MKNFQQNLSIFLALGLCGLCIYQWSGQTRQRNKLERLNQSVYEKSVTISECTNSIATMDRQIAELNARIGDLRQSAETNQQTMAAQRQAISKLEAAERGLTSQIAEYKKAVGTLEGKLQEAYNGIKQQNQAMEEVVMQRDEFVSKYNDSVKERNDVVARYNDLAGQLEKAQSGGKK